MTKAEVTAVRNREGYTLGCGIESNTEAGFDYEELSPRHRWADWRDNELLKMGLKPEAFPRYRRASINEIQYAGCDDTVEGHRYLDAEQAELLGLIEGTCVACGKVDPFMLKALWTWTCSACGKEFSHEQRERAEGMFLAHAQRDHAGAVIVSAAL